MRVSSAIGRKDSGGPGEEQASSGKLTKLFGYDWPGGTVM